MSNRFDLTGTTSFWRVNEELGELSNFAKISLPLHKHMSFPVQENMHPIDDRCISTSEHLYQALKFQHCATVQYQILHADTPKNAKHIARLYHLESTWDDIKLDVMDYVCRLKLALNFTKMKKVLQSTNSYTTIVELSRGDDFWGANLGMDGYKAYWQGDNHLGKIWTNIRADLQKHGTNMLHVPSRQYILCDAIIPDIQGST